MVCGSADSEAADAFARACSGERAPGIALLTPGCWMIQRRARLRGRGAPGSERGEFGSGLDTRREADAGERLALVERLALLVVRHALAGVGINNARDRAAKRRALNHALTALMAAGFGAELTIDGHPRDYETVQRAVGERLEERRTRFVQRGQQAADRSAALLRRSDERVGEVPMGQPLAAGRRGRWLSKAKTGAASGIRSP